MTRPTWDETWADVARTVGKRSRCGRAKVGAVIVDQTNRVVAVAYNGPPSGLSVAWGPDCRSGDHPCARAQRSPDERSPAYDDCFTIHAETNAIAFCDRREREGGTIYVVGAPCYTCAKLIANSGLARVVVVWDGDRSYRDPEVSETFLRSAGLMVDLL